jgi:hypothetical protein
MTKSSTGSARRVTPADYTKVHSARMRVKSLEKRSVALTELEVL